MSRSGYSDDFDGWASIRWRGAVTSAIKGKRGQAALREILAALDALPDKRLVADSLATAEGDYCTLGALGRARGLDMAHIDPEDRQAVAQTFGVAEALAAEIMYLNDDVVVDWQWVDVEICGPMPPYHFPPYGRKEHWRTVRVPNPCAGEKRWRQMRNWVASQLNPAPEQAAKEATA